MIRSYPKGTILYNEGDVLNTMFVVVGGELTTKHTITVHSEANIVDNDQEAGQVTKKISHRRSISSKNSSNGRRATKRDVDLSAFYGEHALLTLGSFPSSHTVSTSCDSILWSIRAEDFVMAMNKRRVGYSLPSLNLYVRKELMHDLFDFEIPFFKGISLEKLGEARLALLARIL